MNHELHLMLLNNVTMSLTNSPTYISVFLIRKTHTSMAILGKMFYLRIEVGACRVIEDRAIGNSCVHMVLGLSRTSCVVHS